MKRGATRPPPPKSEARIETTVPRGAEFTRPATFTEATEATEATGAAGATGSPAPYHAIQLYFSGGAALFPILMVYGEELLRQIEAKVPPATHVSFAGGSSGSLVALCMALGVTTRQLRSLMEDQIWGPVGQGWGRTLMTHLQRYGRKLIYAMLAACPDWRQRLHRRLTIRVTRLSRCGLTPVEISDFPSEMAVVETVMTSCHLFLYGCWPLRVFRGMWCFDGAYFNNPATKPGTLSFFVGYSRLGDTRHLTWLALPSSDPILSLIHI